MYMLRESLVGKENVECKHKSTIWYKLIPHQKVIQLIFILFDTNHTNTCHFIYMKKLFLLKTILNGASFQPAKHNHVVIWILNLIHFKQSPTLTTHCHQFYFQLIVYEFHFNSFVLSHNEPLSNHNLDMPRSQN